MTLNEINRQQAFCKTIEWFLILREIITGLLSELITITELFGSDLWVHMGNMIKLMHQKFNINDTENN